MGVITSIQSPNYDERPAGVMINMIVIHGISLPKGEFGGDDIIKLFTNQLPGWDLRVSAHVLIRREGDILQFVPYEKRAWHAGVSCFEGRENCNDFSIGIELEGADHIAYTDIQYEKLRAIIAELKETYPGIVDSRIVGHSDIAPGRKTDPGHCFDWDRVFKNKM